MDQTRQQDALARLGALERELLDERKARVAAEAESAAKSQLLATVSHELRTPMGAIISMTDLLLAGELRGTQLRYADTLQQSARGLLTILNDILDYSKLEAGRFELEPIEFDFKLLLQGVGDVLSAGAQAKGLDSSIAVVEGCPDRVVGDPVRIRQILGNLTSNALKFTAQGGVHLRVGFGRDGGDIVLRFEMSDTGIGLSERQQKRLFEPYAQGDRSVAIKYGGTGLGLSIARRLARLMRGELGCESAEGQGSVFWFMIRVKPASGQIASPVCSDSETSSLQGHVLIAEDNAVNQMLIAAYLERFGLTYSMATNGKDALRALDNGAYDLILMDIMMPEMDGLEATRHIRSLGDARANIPIVALTANAMKGDRETYLAAGMDAYLSKPLGARDLFNVLAQHLPPAATARRA